MRWEGCKFLEKKIPALFQYIWRTPNHCPAITVITLIRPIPPLFHLSSNVLSDFGLVDQNRKTGTRRLCNPASKPGTWYSVPGIPVPQRPCSFWSAPRITTPGQVQDRSLQFMDFPSLCTCSEPSLTSLIGLEYEMNSLRMFRKLDRPKD